jgi:hypothetical protein
LSRCCFPGRWRWRIALATGQSGRIDAIWAFATGFASVVAAAAAKGDSLRRTLVCAIVAIWSLRLGRYLWRCAIRSRDDPRYAALKLSWRGGAAAAVFFLQIQALASRPLALTAYCAAGAPRPALDGRDGLAVALCALGTTAALAEPKTNMLHQWSLGSDAAAIAKLGEMFTAAGGKWEQTSIAGHTANTLAKLRVDVVAGNAPPAVQLKGPEIAEWNATGMTANLDELANKEGWDKVVAPELLPVMKPTGDWVAAPMNIHRINWIWGSTKAMEKAGIKELPKTWAEFNADCDKAVAAHLIYRNRSDRRSRRKTSQQVVYWALWNCPCGPQASQVSAGKGQLGLFEWRP